MSKKTINIYASDSKENTFYFLTNGKIRTFEKESLYINLEEIAKRILELKSEIEIISTTKSSENEEHERKIIIKTNLPNLPPEYQRSIIYYRPLNNQEFKDLKYFLEKNLK